MAGQEFQDLVDDVTGGESPNAESASPDGAQGGRSTDGGPDELPTLEEFEEMMRNRNR
jgi:hypothetical protein